MAAFKDISLQSFGCLTAIYRSGIQNHHALWRCRCSCDGKEIDVLIGHLLSGHTTSCGCVHRTRLSQASLIHGHTIQYQASPTYRTWANMVTRCTNSHNKDWNRYGGAGIKVCDRWLNSFKAFLEDLGERPSVNHSLSRFLDSGNYEMGNVEWAVKADQTAEAKGKRAMLAMRAFHQTQLVAA